MLLGVLGAVVGTLLSSGASVNCGLEYTPPAPILQNIASLGIRVAVPDELTGVEADIEATLEAKLVDAGLAVGRWPTPESPVFEVEVLAVRDESRFFYTLRAQVTHRCEWPDGNTDSASCTLWHAPPMIGMITSKQLDVLISRTVHAVDQFLASWQSAREQSSTSN